MWVLAQKKRPFLAAELGQEGPLDVRGELFARGSGGGVEGSNERAAVRRGGATPGRVAERALLSERYGPVYTLHLGPQRVVVLCGYQAVKEALVDQAEVFSGRGDLPVVFRFTQGNAAPFDPTFLISRAVSNVICSIVFGDRFDYQDGSFLTLVGLINQNFQLLSSPWGQMYNIFPGPMSCLPGPHNRIFENFEQLRQFVLERVKMHQESFDPNCPRDFIDCFLLKMEQENQDPLSYFHTETLVMTTHNLFFAGTETVSTTLRYGFLLLMKYPEIQAKVHAEIDQVIGRHRSPSVEDRSRMPYTDAVIHEVQRFGDVIPMGLPHAVTRDTHFRGFLLPEGTNVLPLLFSVHNDPAQFKDPATFDPTHFLDPSGGFRKHDAFMAFSAGGWASLRTLGELVSLPDERTNLSPGV
ncbi:cytochrome P450 2F3-like [Terrapene carolina triunguis]|uniref:cytochrome P450 2F3-like n=1 Tax=Terrapene triunguis TaxID=2587831 RepID=UPI00115647C4|nr:cytochrome P450 2F3-like [Terrapene carolina triunguis]